MALNRALRCLDVARSQFCLRVKPVSFLSGEIRILDLRGAVEGVIVIAIENLNAGAHRGGLEGNYYLLFFGLTLCEIFRNRRANESSSTNFKWSHPAQNPNFTHNRRKWNCQ